MDHLDIDNEMEQNILMEKGLLDILNANYDIYINKDNKEISWYVYINNQDGDWCVFFCDPDTRIFSIYICHEYDENGAEGMYVFNSDIIDIDTVKKAFALSKEKRENGIIRDFDPEMRISKNNQNCFFTYYRKVNKNDFEVGQLTEHLEFNEMEI